MPTPDGDTDEAEENGDLVVVLAAIFSNKLV